MVSDSVSKFYVGGSYGYDKKILEFKTGDGYLDFDFNVNNVTGYNAGLTLGYICPSASLNNFRTDLEFMYITKKKIDNNKEVVDEDREKVLQKKMLYWNNNKYKVFFNLYYDVGNFFSIRDFTFFFGAGVDLHNFIGKLLKNTETLDLKSNLMMQSIVGIKYQLLNNIIMYGGYRYFIGYMKPKDNINFKRCYILGSYGLMFGLEFVF
ncbi:outer membrane beta-barrel domain protein [Ehrlichia chaffeensis str. Heartland]|nr:outer membrane beta-barrel protein [Ehrlichia chaffeensis]AHX03753.1 outer membrane beta-barrel domain protein [Ehrlichia chaffeensis str. Heartland]AHX05523.1 outer membrane beta-barrel domain protein [Ehrlichia chaffeensis str. Jax]AHX06513.1 outer membrane beta-barrel domain protein [Ehrlichia chaffeensis str. Liberty]AHX07959.1 outer membrane beta-barrel domain protein [Ehrlichia chaffeensis str. Osceola]AHX08414.1 outer membrane beta-barrel domain protein [Ehrlichia chaffeensis str. Sa